jgi:hypothetical protein
VACNSPKRTSNSLWRKINTKKEGGGGVGWYSSSTVVSFARTARGEVGSGPELPREGDEADMLFTMLCADGVRGGAGDGDPKEGDADGGGV